MINIALFLCAIAQTSPVAEADKFVARGIELREKGKDDEALDAFRRAYELSKGGRALAQVALAEQALGRWLEAEAHLRAALDFKQDKWIASNRSALESALRTIEQRLGSIEVLCTVSGAEVKLNSRSVGRCPLSVPIRVVAGSVVLEVEADGYWPFTRKLMVESGAVLREPVELAPKLTTAPVAASPAVPPPYVASPPPVVTSRGGMQSPGTFGVGLGLGVIGAAGGIAASVLTGDGEMGVGLGASLIAASGSMLVAGVIFAIIGASSKDEGAPGTLSAPVAVAAPGMPVLAPGEASFMLTISARPDGARILVEGHEIGVNEGKAQLAAGQNYSVIVERPPFRTETRSIKLDRDERMEIALELPPEASDARHEWFSVAPLVNITGTGSVMVGGWVRAPQVSFGPFFLLPLEGGGGLFIGSGATDVASSGPGVELTKVPAKAGLWFHFGPGAGVRLLDGRLEGGVGIGLSIIDPGERNDDTFVGLGLAPFLRYEFMRLDSTVTIGVGLRSILELTRSCGGSTYALDVIRCRAGSGASIMLEAPIRFWGF